MKTFLLAVRVAVLACAQPFSSSVDDSGAARISKHHANEEMINAASMVGDAAVSALRREPPESLSQTKSTGEVSFQMAMSKLEDKIQLQKRLEASEEKSRNLEDKLERMEKLLERTQSRLALLETKVSEAQSVSQMISGSKMQESSLLEEERQPPWPFELSAGDNKELQLNGYNLKIVSKQGHKGNLIIGHSHNYADATNGLVVGRGNTIRDDGSVALGGASCAAFHGGATLGGTGSQASGQGAVVAGGNNNAASGKLAVAIGGSSNEAKADYSGVYGGKTLVAEGSNLFQYHGHKHHQGHHGHHQHGHHHHHGEQHKHHGDEYDDGGDFHEDD